MTATFKNMTTLPKNGMRPVHPGEILREDYLKPLGMSAHALAKVLQHHRRHRVAPDPLFRRR